MIIVRTERWLAAATLVLGAVAWTVYADRDLILSHYDAKAHLVVARRVIDNITPGWQQFGAVWLPLPHLIHVIPTQVDLFYRTGVFASLVSMLSFAVAVWAAARLVRHLTGSQTGAATAGALLALNPNWLYLQATPMTEPLLLALLCVSVLWMWEWVVSAAPEGDGGAANAGSADGGGTVEAGPGRASNGGREDSRRDGVRRPPPDAPRMLGGALFAAMWTRYEAWPVVTALLVLSAHAIWRRGVPMSTALRSVASIALWPAAAVLIFLVNSRITVGAWFVAGGFYVPDPLYEAQFWRSLVAVWWGIHRLVGYVVATGALVAALLLVARALGRQPARAATTLLPAALLTACALPLYAFYQGHPFRIRYMAVGAAAAAVLCGIGVGSLARLDGRWPRWTAAAAGALLVGSLLLHSPPLDPAAPMLEEAQWDRPRSQQRRAVTACLAGAYRGEKVMASMGSLAHYMQELASAGLKIEDFLHEGNGIIWQTAFASGPAAHAGWMLVEEEAEGGDILAQRARADAAFLRGMVRTCDGGGVALYRRE